MAKPHLNILPSLKNGFSSSQSKKSNHIIAGEQEKGKWSLVSMSSTEQVENVKYPTTKAERQEMWCFSSL